MIDSLVVITLNAEICLFLLINKFLRIAVFLVMSIVTYYMLLEYAGMDIEISALIAGVISAIIIMVLDFKKFHFREKMR